MVSFIADPRIKRAEAQRQALMAQALTPYKLPANLPHGGSPIWGNLQRLATGWAAGQSGKRATELQATQKGAQETLLAQLLQLQTPSPGSTLNLGDDGRIIGRKPFNVRPWESSPDLLTTAGASAGDVALAAQKATGVAQKSYAVLQEAEIDRKLANVTSAIAITGEGPERARLQSRRGQLLAIKDAAQAAIRQESQEISLNERGPMSPMGKLADDLAEGRITLKQYNQALRKQPLIDQRGQSAFAATAGELQAKQLMQLVEQSGIAYRNIDQIERIKAALKSGRFQTGLAATPRYMLAQFAEMAGIDAGEISSLIGSAATADTLDAASKTLAARAAKNLGRVTNMSLGFIRDSLPALSRTQEGNEILVEVLERTALREIEIGALADQYIAKGTMHPKGEPSFVEARADLEKKDPVISKELREQIIGGAKQAIGVTWRDALRGDTDKVGPPPADPALRVVGQRYANPEGIVAVWTESGWEVE